MNNIDASNKLVELMEESIGKEIMENLSYEILDIGRQLVIHVDFPTHIGRLNIIFNRKFFQNIKKIIGLELISLDLIPAEPDVLRQIDYMKLFMPYPCVEIVFENPDVKEQDIEKFYVVGEGEEEEKE